MDLVVYALLNSKLGKVSSEINSKINILEEDINNKVAILDAGLVPVASKDGDVTKNAMTAEAWERLNNNTVEIYASVDGVLVKAIYEKNQNDEIEIKTNNILICTISEDGNVFTVDWNSFYTDVDLNVVEKGVFADIAKKATYSIVNNAATNIQIDGTPATVADIVSQDIKTIEVTESGSTYIFEIVESGINKIYVCNYGNSYGAVIPVVGDAGSLVPTWYDRYARIYVEYDVDHDNCTVKNQNVAELLLQTSIPTVVVLSYKSSDSVENINILQIESKQQLPNGSEEFSYSSIASSYRGGTTYTYVFNVNIYYNDGHIISVDYHLNNVDDYGIIGVDITFIDENTGISNVSSSDIVYFFKNSKRVWFHGYFNDTEFYAPLSNVFEKNMDGYTVHAIQAHAVMLGYPSHLITLVMPWDIDTYDVVIQQDEIGLYANTLWVDVTMVNDSVGTTSVTLGEIYESFNTGKKVVLNGDLDNMHVIGIVSNVSKMPHPDPNIQDVDLLSAQALAMLSDDNGNQYFVGMLMGYATESSQDIRMIMNKLNNWFEGSGYSAVSTRGSYAEGDYSVAEGASYTTYDGSYAHSEGNSTTADGWASHVEGYDTIALDDAAHAEGMETRADGAATHAEGYQTTAYGLATHAEGALSEVHGIGSHAEGLATYAGGAGSHAGGIGNFADVSYSTVIGSASWESVAQQYSVWSSGTQYEVGDIVWYGDPDFYEGAVRATYQCIQANDDEYFNQQHWTRLHPSDGEHVFVIGNGYFDPESPIMGSEFSNAMAVDWDGNVKIAGDIYVRCDYGSYGGYKLAPVINCTVTGSTPTIIAEENYRYICGTVTSLSFTPSVTGICDVIFTSGSTPTVLTMPNSVKLPDWFSTGTLEANTTYEINVMDGVYGVVMAWT